VADAEDLAALVEQAGRLGQGQLAEVEVRYLAVQDGSNPRELGVRQTRVGEIGWAVEDRNTDPLVAEGLCPEFSKAQNLRRNRGTARGFNRRGSSYPSLVGWAVTYAKR
jgi:hypothetical protein